MNERQYCFLPELLRGSKRASCCRVQGHSYSHHGIWVKRYELKFNLERLKLIEAAKKSSLMGEYYTTNGMFSIQTCELVFQFATKEAGSDTFIGQVDGSKLCEQALMQRGYATIALEIQNALTKDMPFLFQAN